MKRKNSAGTELASDTARLDWLEKHRCTVYKSAMSGTHWVVVNEDERDRTGRLGTTLRDAIDDAMKPR